MVALVVVLLGAGPAWAHAGVDSTSPAQGTELAAAPASVSVRFGEAVGINSRSIEVLDPRGHRVDDGQVSHPNGLRNTVAVGLHSGLAKASYLVVWRVVSADSHPVSGTFSFGYGVPAGQVTAAPKPGDPGVRLLHGFCRFAALAGTVVLIGGTFFFGLLWKNGLRWARGRRLLALAWALTTFGTLGLVLLEGPYGSSLGLAEVGDPSLLGVTFGTIYGKLLLLRLLALGAAALVWRTIGPQGRPPSWLDAGGLALLIVESFSFAGHAGQGTWVPLAATMDALHVLAASVWLGGLVVLVGVLTDASVGTAGVLRELLPRWSRVALVAVTGLVASGVYSAWREIGSIDALLATSYGRLVLAKVAALVALLVLGNLGRSWSRRGASMAQLRRSVAAEVTLGVVVLALTATLVNTVPARQSYSPAFSASLTGQGVEGDRIGVRVVIQPARFGYQTVRIETTTAAGEKLAVQSASGSLTYPALGLGPIEFTLHPTGAGRAEASAVSVPAPGRWQLVLQVHTDQFTDYSAATTYLVR